MFRIYIFVEYMVKMTQLLLHVSIVSSKHMSCTYHVTGHMINATAGYLEVFHHVYTYCDMHIYSHAITFWALPVTVLMFEVDVILNDLLWLVYI